jgi:Rps23 Pro-64 3,4-dihydroxylase Tpa1-like proline 4-hydroxylase
MIRTENISVNAENVYGDADTLNIQVYEDVLSASAIGSFSHYINQATLQQTRHNVEGRNFNINGSNVKLSGTAQRHNYIKIWDIGEYAEYYSQTKDSIIEFYQRKLQDITPGLRQFVSAIGRADIFADDEYVALRLFVNCFPNGQCMEVHLDGDKYKINVDLETNNLWSSTFYLEVPEEGGELWFPNLGIKHKPKLNSMVIFNGNKFYHGVTEVPNTYQGQRISITVRYAKVKDLMLPGSVDKFVFKPKLETLIP